MHEGGRSWGGLMRDCLGEFDPPGPRAINVDIVFFKNGVLYLKIVIWIYARFNAFVIFAC